MYPKSNERKPVNVKNAQESNSEKQERRKSKLIEEMKRKQQEVKPAKEKQPKPRKKKIADDREILRLKKEIAELKSEVKKARNEAAAERKKTRSYKKQLRELEAASKKEIAEISQEAGILSQQAEMQFELAAHLHEELINAGWDEQRTAAEVLKARMDLISFLLVQCDKAQEKIYRLKKNQSKHFEMMDRLEEKLKIQERSATTATRQLGKKEEQLKKTIHENEILKKRCSKMQQNIRKINSVDPQIAISQLIQQLSVRNFWDFNQLNKLFEMYRRVFEYHAHDTEHQNSDVMYGYLEINEKGQRFFHDINDELRIPVVVQGNFKRRNLLKDGMAVQVFRKKNTPGSVTLGYCYPVMERIRTENKSLKKTKAAPSSASEDFLITNQDVKAWAEEITITVVGGKRTQRFCDELSKYVKKVERIDTYEKGENRTFELIQASSYTFVLTDSVPHSVTDFVKGYDPTGEKVQSFYLPSKYDGVIRLHYLYWNRKDA